MINDSTSVIIHFCEEHLDTDVESFYPGYCFNCLTTVEGRKCRIDGCIQPGIMKFIGYKVPDVCSDLSAYLNKESIPEQELLEEAYSALSIGPARDALAVFLFSKIRVAPMGGDLPAMKLCKVFALLLLHKLKISPVEPLLKIEVDALLKEMELYPVGD